MEVHNFNNLMCLDKRWKRKLDLWNLKIQIAFKVEFTGQMKTTCPHHKTSIALFWERRVFQIKTGQSAMHLGALALDISRQSLPGATFNTGFPLANMYSNLTFPSLASPRSLGLTAASLTPWVLLWKQQIGWDGKNRFFTASTYDKLKQVEPEASEALHKQVMTKALLPQTGWN